MMKNYNPKDVTIEAWDLTVHNEYQPSDLRLVDWHSYILNNQGKKKTARLIIDALSEMNGSEVLMGTQNSRNEKSPEVF